MNIYDCFMYFDEDMLLDLRLNVLNDHVKKFIISEATYTHNGSPKKLNFDINKFRKFKDKIEYIIVDKQPSSIFQLTENENAEERGKKLILNGMARDYFQRESLKRGLVETSDDDLILISDLDEIPKLDELNFSKIKNNIVIFEQKMFYYKFNLLNTTDPFWYGTKICKKKHLKSPQWLRDQKVKKYSFWKFYKIKWNIIKDGGWHFSFLMNAEQIKSKIESYAHAEFNNKNFNNLEKINFSLENQVDLFDRKIEFEKIIFDETFPKYILNNKEKYKNWIL